MPVRRFRWPMAESDTEVVVWSSRLFQHIGFSLYGGGGGSENSLSPTEYISPEPGGYTGLPVLTIPHSWKCPSKDSAAKKAAEVIIAHPASVTGEITGAIVQLSDGSFGISRNELSVFEGVESMVRGIEADLVRLQGDIHNHPRGVPGRDADAAADRYPSETDWDGVAMLKANRPEVDLSNYTLYIVDHVGDVRAFRYLDRHLYPSNEQRAERKDGVNLPPVINNSSDCHQ